MGVTPRRTSPGSAPPRPSVPSCHLVSHVPLPLYSGTSEGPGSLGTVIWREKCMRRAPSGSEAALTHRGARHQLNPNVLLGWGGGFLISPGLIFMVDSSFQHKKYGLQTSRIQ